MRRRTTTSDCANEEKMMKMKPGETGHVGKKKMQDKKVVTVAKVAAKVAEGKKRQGDHGGGAHVSEAPEADAARGARYNFRIRDQPAFSQLEVFLRPGERIVSNGGALSYVREGVALGKLEKGGSVWDMVKRVFAEQALFFDSYDGLPGYGEEARTVAFASHYPGDMMTVKLGVGQRMVLSRDAYLASSPNVKVTGRFNLRGLFGFGQDEGFMLPELLCEAPGPEDGTGPMGYAFIASYGAFQEHRLEANQSLLVNNGLFLACYRDLSHDTGAPLYTVVQLGRSFLSTVLGGEGLGMRFEGPCVVYTQSRSFDDLVGLVAARLPPPSSAPPLGFPPSGNSENSGGFSGWNPFGGKNQKAKAARTSKKR